MTWCCASRRSLERLGQDNLHEDRQAFEGEFQGVLPKRRTFEFKVRDADTVITGKIGPAISDADTLNEHQRSSSLRSQRDARVAYRQALRCGLTSLCPNTGV